MIDRARLLECLLSNFDELLYCVSRMPTDLESIPPEHPDHNMKEYARLIRNDNDELRDADDDDIADMLVDAMYQRLPDEIMI